MSRVIIILYSLIGAVHLFTTYFIEYTTIYNLTSYALIPLLIILVLIKKGLKSCIWLTLGLLSFLVADILRITDGLGSLNWQLLAFSVGHILYWVAFRRMSDQNHEILLMKRAPLAAIIPAALILLAFLKIRAELGEHELPMLLYSITLILLVIGALNRQKKASFLSFQTVLIGAFSMVIFFVVSSFDQFNERIPLAATWAMASYILAQLFIVRGLLLTSD